ncbi:MAG: phosphate ABC transporter permease [Desulfuromonas sp. SDB]|nr:MAG: phosphate ABC transporter permease [Desulfuromonas sp. SDB]
MKSDTVFKYVLHLIAVIILALLSLIFITLFVNSLPSIKSLGLKFFISTRWNPVKGEFGALPFLVGTLITSFLALIISTPFSLSIAVFLSEYFKRGALSSVIRSGVELLSGIPSVIYGFWGLFVLVPVIRNLELKLHVPPYGVGIFTASLLLAIMIIPYSASIIREVMKLVPADLKEAAYSLGATRFEVLKGVVIPYSKSGITAGLILALGRALGETMAVTMVIGNANVLPTSIFAPSNTMASIIANEFSEAVDSIYLSSLVELGLLLIVVSAAINIISRWVIKRTSKV